MLIYEYQVDGNQQQYAAIDEAIRVVQFIGGAFLNAYGYHDLIAYERLQISNLVKNRELAKSISNAA